MQKVHKDGRLEMNVRSTRQHSASCHRVCWSRAGYAPPLALLHLSGGVSKAFERGRSFSMGPRGCFRGPLAHTFIQHLVLHTQPSSGHLQPFRRNPIGI